MTSRPCAPGCHPRGRIRVAWLLAATALALWPLPPSAAASKVDTNPAEPRSWQLTASDLKALLLPPPAPSKTEALAAVIAQAKDVADGNEGDPKAAEVPTAEQREGLLRPLEDLEFPSEALLRHALRASASLYCEARAKAKASAPATRKKVWPERDNPDSGGELTLAQCSAQLMPQQWEDELVAQAVKRHPLTGLQPLQLQARAGCGCSLPTDEAYGLLAYWHAQPDPLEVDFSLFTRIGLLGAVLQADGSTSTSYASQMPRGLEFVRTAREHATRVDLVIHGRDWAFLRSQETAEERQRYIAGAASRALDLADTPLEDNSRKLHRLLAPAWRESDHAFDGITLFFEPGQARDAENFRVFLNDFVPTLLREMRARKRPLRLNVVVPDHLIGDTGTYSIDWLWRTWIATEEGLSDAQKEARRTAAHAGKSARMDFHDDVTLQYLVLLSEPTSAMKKSLRARLDASRTVTGDMRVRLLQNMVPVLLHQQAGKVEPLSAKRHQQLEGDLAYLRWNYGGVALWPLPAQNLGSGLAVQEAVRRAYSETPELAQRTLGDHACSVLCPRRVELRLALQLLLLIGFVSIGLHIRNRKVRQPGKPYLVTLWAGGLLTGLVALSLLGCDPAMQRWRNAETLFALLLVPLFVWGTWRKLRSRQTRP